MIPADFALQLAACAGMRNRIVHEYDEIDPRKICKGLQAAVRDIPRYLAGPLEYVGHLPTAP